MYRIKELAKSQEIAIKELANRINVAPNTLSRIINGENTTVEMLQKIAKILDVEVRDLFINDEVSGFIKIRGKIYEVNSEQDLKNIVNYLAPDH